MIATASKAVLGTQSVHKAPHDVSISSRLPFDGGNRFLKWFGRDGSLRKMPSYIKLLEDYQDLPPVSDAQSVVIETADERFVLGELAKQLGGTPIRKGNKCELAEKLVLAAIEPAPGQHQMLIETLAIALPDSRKARDANHLHRIARTHAFKRNGQLVHAMVRKVDPVDECLSAWRFAYRKGLYQYKRNNAVLDLGGGTGIGRIITPAGVIDRRSEVLLPGTYNLANKIAGALKAKLTYSADLGLIMDAIEDGSHVYPTAEGTIPFSAEFMKCRDEWLTEIRATLKEAWVDQLSQVGEILIVGGSAHLAQSLDGKGRYRIPQYQGITNFPQFISLYGLTLEG